MIDSTEMYYASMEAMRANAEDKYFDARPSSDTKQARIAFQAGFERAFKLLWDSKSPSSGPEKP